MTRSVTHRTLLGSGMILLECFLWGLGNPLIKIVQNTLPTFLFLSLRFAIAFVMMFLLYGKRILRSFQPQQLRRAFVPSLWLLVLFITANLALRYASATSAGFLMGISVLFTPILSYFFHKKKIQPARWLPIVIVTAGTYLMCGTEGGFGFGAGELIALLSSVSAAFNLIYTARALEDMDVIALSAIQYLFVAVSSLLLSLLLEDVTTVTRLSGAGWGIVLYTALGSTFLAFLLQNLSLTLIPSVHASLLLCAEPLFTALFAFFLLEENLGFTGFLGSLLIIASILLATFQEEGWSFPCLFRDKSDKR